MKNRFLTMLLCIVMALSLLPAMAFAATKVASQAELEDAIANATGATTIELSDGKYTLSGTIANKNITFSGSKSAVIEILTAVNATGSTITFNGVTVKFDNDNYEGLQHSAKVVYKNCTHIGTEFLYAPVVAYTNCTFEQYDSNTEYHVWTYGAEDVTFNNCTFNTGGKAILVYNESKTDTFVADIKLNNCTFNSDGSVATNKAAVETGASPYGKNTYKLTFKNCTANGFVANNSDSPLWGNKNNMDTAHLGIVVSGKTAALNTAMPKTGDASNLTLCLMALLASMAGFALMRRREA